MSRLKRLITEIGRRPRSSESARIAERVAIFNSWLDCSIDKLIDIVTAQRFYEPMDVLHGSLHIIERLYKIHGPQLTDEHLDRLEQFAGSTDAHCDQISAQLMLKGFLAVLKNDPCRLKPLWEHQCSNSDTVWWSNRNIDWWAWPALTDAAGDLPTTDRGIIEYLIRVVATPFMFAPRYSAMVGLGKIGPPAGQHAIEVITRSIYDSSEDVTAIRDRVVARIREPAGSWVRCSHCHRGYVDAMAYDIPSVEECVECLGLGHVPRSAS